jgi:large subunit ribosomal protein L16
MKQNPSRLKFRKNHKPGFSFFSLLDKKNFYPLRGSFALKSLGAGRLNLKQLEAGRKSIRRNVKKVGLVSVNIFTGRSITEKPMASRMGKGKGGHSAWVATIRKGQILYELTGVPANYSIKALNRARNKMPLKTKVIKLFF